MRPSTVLLGAQALVTLALGLGLLRLQWTQPANLWEPRAVEAPSQPATESGVAEAFSAYLEGTACFVDGRDPERYRAGHIPGAIPLRVSEASLVAGLPYQPLLIVYADGPAERELSEAVRPWAHGVVRPLTGGASAWVAAGHPTLP